MSKIFFLTFSLAISLYAFFDEDEATKTLEVPVEERHVKVSVVSPKTADMNISIEVHGITEPVLYYTVNSQSDGVLHTKVINTQKVKKGEIVATLESPALTNKIMRLQNSVRLYKEQLNIESKKLNSCNEMLKMGIIGSNDYLTQKAVLTEKEAALSNAKGELENLNLMKLHSVIKAPISGYITNLQADGTYISYANPICNVQTDSVQIRLYIPVLYQKTIKKGQNVTLHVGQEDVHATVSQILPSTTNNLAEVIAQTKTPLLVGLNVEASIDTQKKSGWIIPKDSIILVQNRPAVFIIKNNTAHLHFVDVQKDMIDKVLIIDQLSTEDKIAYKNSYMLHDNSVVEVTQ